MRTAIKYKFNNVLVADAKLLVDMATGGQAPDVLVLNSKLYKCQAHQVNCSSCCLNIEQPEFRRRLGQSDDLDQCFADCSGRRSVNVELSAKAQLSGKIVILDQFFDLPDSLIRCQTTKTWSFYKFEPNSSHIDPKQNSYSRLSSNQAPSMLIDSVNVSWDPKSYREQISLKINPNSENRLKEFHHKQIIMKETLLISELNCYKPLVETNQSSTSSLFDESDHESLIPKKVHLLTLINRQLSTYIPSNDTAHSAPAKVDPSRLVDLPPESHIDYPPAASYPKSIVSFSQSSTPSTAPAPQTRARSLGTTTLNHQISPSYSLNTKRPNDSSLNVLHMQVPFLHNKYEFKINESSQMGPAFVLEHDLTRMRLKPGGFLVLAISSSLVILTYTLCLIAYLRYRHRIRSKSRVSNITSKFNDDKAVVPIQRVGLNISQPYNLQMPSATRTRLEMMLRKGIRSDRTRATIPSTSTTSQNKVDDSSMMELRLAERRRRSRLLMLATNRDRLSSSISSRHKQISKTGDSAAAATGGRRHSQCKQRQLNFGSIKVVRAIRQAATLARSRLHLNSRYRPNLNVIPESDLEYLQSPRGNGGELYRGLFDHNNLVYISPPHRARSEVQFDTLVQDALRTDCSHYVDKMTSQAQATSTLFSKPIGDTNTPDSVSRSEILRQVKHEDIFGNQDSERADI